MGQCEEQIGKFTCCALGKGHPITFGSSLSKAKKYGNPSAVKAQNVQTFGVRTLQMIVSAFKAEKVRLGF